MSTAALQSVYCQYSANVSSFGILRASAHLFQFNLSIFERKFKMWRELCVRRACVATWYTRGAVGAQVATAVTFALNTLWPPGEHTLHVLTVIFVAPP